MTLNGIGNSFFNGITHLHQSSDGKTVQRQAQTESTGLINFKGVDSTQRKDLDKPLNTVVTKKEYSIHRRNGEIMNMLMKQKKVSFDELFDVWSKDYVVVTFLSILDLAKKGKINISQAHNLDNIILEVKE